jgi:glutamate dehydrogenase/leucine dehydrogenase
MGIFPHLFKNSFIVKVEKLIEKFEGKQPEIVFAWKDDQTEAEGWVVINSLRNGAAGGGTRMRKGLNQREVESLAKTMEVKFTIAGPPIGGGCVEALVQSRSSHAKTLLWYWRRFERR